LAALTLQRLEHLRELLERKAELDRATAYRRALQYRLDPVGWARERCDHFLWSKQREIVEAVRDHRRVAVQSCHGVGKSDVASVVASWWMDTHPADRVFLVTTAPTYAQVRAILWRYIRVLHKAGELPGRVNQTEWHLEGELRGYGRKPADTDQSAFQGIHGDVLVILDEACGIPEQLWVAADALTTNPSCRILAIGNPDNPGTHFREVCRPESLWHKIKISAFESPNLTSEDIPAEVAEYLISRAWVEEKAAEWGEDNPLYISKVLGEFPDQDPMAVVRYSDVQTCRLDIEVPRAAEELLPVELGVDVGGGGDLTVIRERRGMVAGREWTSNSDRPEDLAPLVIRAIVETGATAVKIDSIGIGWGLCGELRNRARRGEHAAAIVEVNVAEAAREPGKFANLRAELWWEVGRVASEQRAWDLSKMANADRTIAELVEPRYDIDPKGRIRVESKDDIRERSGGRSPDHADALLLAFYAPPNSLGSWIERYAQAARKGR
jgi:hypothetical protein